jgi:tRNA threonylcarbamoyladenosine biosynthesis protein TsaB
LLLAIDTSTMQAGIALYAGALLAELTWPAGRHGSQTLLPEIDRLLDMCGRPATGIAGIGVALGPGSFSALRVGLSAAKGLAFALGCPLIGISTLEVTAYPHRYAGLPIWAVIDAGRARIAAGCYMTIDDRWSAVDDLVHGAARRLLERLTGPALVCGELSESLVAELRERPDLVLPEPSLRQRRPGVLAELTWQRLRAGAVDDPTTLEPLYLHAAVSGAPS